MPTNETPTGARAFRGEHKAKPLKFDPAKLKGLSERLIQSHWENNYGGALKALNAIERRLAVLLSEEDLPPYVYGDLKREELVRTGSVVLHEHYFDNLGGDGRASGHALELLTEWFGGYEVWRAEFTKMANGLAGGSGWVILTYNLHTRGAAQPLGVGPHAQRADGAAPARARHVRAFLPSRLRGRGCEVRRSVHGERRLGRGQPTRGGRARRTAYVGAEKGAA